MISGTIFIFYVADQQKSRDFYREVLGRNPVLDVPGMTEFEINSSSKLGLMPEKGIVKILGDKTPDPANGNGIPRCELYLYVDKPVEYLERAIKAGAKEISALEKRNWGDEAAYCADADGNIIVFAKRISAEE
jgi:uncharacterized glyoxalase superfamily protein PhnB